MSTKIDEAIYLIRLLEFEKARDYLQNLLALGIDEAYLYLGHVYAFDPDKNPIHNYDKAYHYYKKSYEVAGFFEAYICIADMYKFGFLGKLDCAKALNIYLEIIDYGYSARGYLYWVTGLLYLDGFELDNDLDIAKKYFSKGWKERHIPSLSAYATTCLKQKAYLKGLCVRIKVIVVCIHWYLFDKDPNRIRMS